MKTWSSLHGRTVVLAGLFGLWFVLVACDRRSGFDQRLSGTWAATWRSPSGATFASTTTINTNGDYAARILVNGAPGKQSLEEEGTVAIRDGLFVNTMTNYCNTNLARPITTRGHLVRLDSRELVVHWDPNDGIATKDVVCRKLEH
ncbi:MAG TPA: hypothetical protein VHI52_18575 [Verrucomicrobiae bacterium]|nr:hypothetical protein [Verrucomicrobiae bacterium]